MVDRKILPTGVREVDFIWGEANGAAQQPTVWNPSSGHDQGNRRTHSYSEVARTGLLPRRLRHKDC